VSDLFEPSFTESLTAQWNKGPRVFRNALRVPLFDDGDFMTALRGAAREYMADPGARVPPGRLYLNGEMLKPAQLGPLLPRGAETCDQYVSRIVLAHPEDGIGIVLDNCEKHVAVMRDGLVPVLHHLFAHAGYPARRNHLCIYAGNYRSTPFGIHRDDCHVVMFCGVGKKKMAFWPRPYFDEKKDLLLSAGKVRAKVPDHIDAATVLEIGPLDALYWSADDWHVAVSETTDFQAALSVGIYHHGASGEVMTALDVMAAVTKQDGLDIEGLPAATEGRLSVDALRDGQMSEFFARWAQLQELMSRSGELEYRALGLALRLISSAGYGPVRTPPGPLPELSGSALRCAVPESLLVASAQRGLMVGANGHAFVYEHTTPAIEAAVLGLRDGAVHRVDDLMASVDAASRETMAAVLRDLITARALSVQP
jgi:hypothetical protein